MNSQGLGVGHTVKIAKNGPFLAAGTGCMSLCRAYLDWFLGGLRGDCPPMLFPDGKDGIVAWGFLFTPDGFCITFEPSGPNHMRAEFVSEGSGSQVALGAMAHGASAEEAVRIACQFDGNSSLPLTILTHEV